MIKLKHIGHLSCITLAVAIVVFVVNYVVFQYPGNNYIPPKTFVVQGLLLLMLAGSILQYGKASPFTQIALELNLFIFVMLMVALLTNAIQLTPFPPIDKTLVQWEEMLPFTTLELMHWTSRYPQFKAFLEFIYASLSYQMSFIPLIVILLNKPNIMREHYYLLLATALIGFVFYYFFPTTAPASIYTDYLFTGEQKATYLKFYQIHHGILPSTLAGGLIALPSFHVIWAWLCVYLTRPWPILFTLLLVTNIVLTASCVLLGWHYLIDILGSIVCILLGHGCVYASHAERFSSISFNTAANRQPA